MSPERGDVGSRTNHRRRLLDRERGFKPRGKHFSSTAESVDTRVGNKSTRTTTDITFLQQGHKPRSEENKQFDPGGKGEKAPPWNAAVTLLLYLGRVGRLLACASCFPSVLCLCFVCALFSKLLFFPGDTSQRAEKHEGRRRSSRRCTQPEGKHFLVYHPLEDGEDKQHLVWS